MTLETLHRLAGKIAKLEVGQGGREARGSKLISNVRLEMAHLGKSGLSYPQIDWI